MSDYWVVTGESVGVLRSFSKGLAPPKTNMTMENPPFEDVISYRNYSNCSSRKSISVPFLLIKKLFSPKRCNTIASPRLRGVSLNEFFGKIEAKPYPWIFHVERIYFIRITFPKKAHCPGVLFFQPPSKLHVQPWSIQPVFLGMPGAD